MSGGAQVASERHNLADMEPNAKGMEEPQTVRPLGGQSQTSDNLGS